VTFCLDDCEVASYRVRGGRVRSWILPQSRRDAHWERARQKFGLTGDDVYQDDDAERFAEGAMLEEALDHWGPAANEPHRSRKRVRIWWNRPVTRDIMTELYINLGALPTGPNEQTRRSEKDERGMAKEDEDQEVTERPRRNKFVEYDAQAILDAFRRANAGDNDESGGEPEPPPTKPKNYLKRKKK
jgi:hypothetical protein